MMTYSILVELANN